MKQTCPRCNEIISIDENLYRDKETVDVECPICGNKVIFTIHHEYTNKEETTECVNPNLTKCPECGNLVSRKAESCPHCGVVLLQQKLSSNNYAEKSFANNANSQKNKEPEILNTSRSHKGLWIGLCIGVIALVSVIVVMMLTMEENASAIKEENKTTGSYNGHDWVDLGLPSGTLWATCNVGANTPEEYGNYYAWGETTTKRAYNEENYSYSSNADAATANWGDGWRIPSYDEQNELQSNCTVTWTAQKGIYGCLFKGPNGNSIFLPAAGDRVLGELCYASSCGYYWSSSINSDNPDRAWYIFFNSDGSGMNYYYGYRRCGLSIRPVRSSNGCNGASPVQMKENKLNGHEYVDLGLPSGTKWASCNVGANSPEDYGDYYSWGETRTKSSYSLSDYNYYGEPSTLSGSVDVANTKWGSKWRMPTKEDFDELKNKCSWEWITQNGKTGYRATGPNGKSIFIPAAGNHMDNTSYYRGSYCLYWLSTSVSSKRAWYCEMCQEHRVTYQGDRYLGLTIRPVCNF